MTDTKEIDIEYIKNRIRNEICQRTLDELSDVSLLPEFMKCKSVDGKIDELKEILVDHNIPPPVITSIISSYVSKMIPAGTKGSVRGKKFNEIVKQRILSFGLDEKLYDIQFEKYCEDIKTSELPDFYIQHKITKKTIIGMNQLDLWGGAQLNRGYKYIFESKLNTPTSKLLCVVCKDADIRGKKSKMVKILNKGFKNDTLCYLGNLKIIINKFFETN